MLKMMKSLICFIFVFLLLLRKLLFRRGETLIFGFCFFVQSFASMSCPFYLVPVCNFKNSKIVKDIRIFYSNPDPVFLLQSLIFLIWPRFLITFK